MGRHRRGGRGGQSRRDDRCHVAGRAR